MKQVTLLYLRRDNQLLIAMKKRGFGQGMYNGVGGKVEPGETVEQAAIRECQEEIGVTPCNLQLVGRLHFSTPNDPAFAHDCFVFVAHEWDGEPAESEEMRPEWCGEDKLPLDKMWPDDEVWLPYLLEGKLFEGTVNTSEDQLIGHTIKTVNALSEES